MTVIYLSRIMQFAKSHANARKRLSTWKSVVENALWKSKQDILNDFPKAEMIRNNRAGFEIVHNTYRLIAYIDYEDEIMEVRFIGTHTEYDRIDLETI